MMTYHVRFLLLVLAGWVNRQQQDVIDYLREENRVLRAELRRKRCVFETCYGRLLLADLLYCGSQRRPCAEASTYKCFESRVLSSFVFLDTTGSGELGPGWVLAGAVTFRSLLLSYSTQGRHRKAFGVV